MPVVHARLLVAVTALAALAWLLAYLGGSRLAPTYRARPAAAMVASIDVAADPGSACSPGNLVGDSPTTLFFGIYSSGLRPGLHLSLAITGPSRTDDVNAVVPASGPSGCAVVAVPASADQAQVWAGGDYSVSVALGSPLVPSGPVTAFEISSGVADD